MLVESGGKRLLVDCGPDIRSQLLNAGVGDLDAVIITHEHADHCHGIDELRPIAQRRGPVPLYGRAHVLEQLKQRFNYAFAGSGFYSPVVEAVEAKRPLAVGDATIRFVDQPHGDVTSLGLRIDEHDRSAVYAIDFSPMSQDMVNLYENSDVLICDCLRRQPHPTHSHLEAVLGWAKELRVSQLYLTHMNASMDYATLKAELPDWAAPAYDGLEIEL